MQEILSSLHQKFIFCKGGKDTTEDFPQAMILKQCNCFWKITESQHSLSWKAKII